MSAPCPFEKVILGGRCGCEHAERFAVGERIGIACASPTAHHNCRTFIALMRDRARFALKTTDSSVPWPFGKEMRVMLGGLIGLKQLLTDGKNIATAEAEQANGRQRALSPAVENIHALIRRAQEVYGALDELPFQTLIQSISRRPLRGRDPRP